MGLRANPEFIQRALSRTWALYRGVWKREGKLAFLRRVLRIFLTVRYEDWVLKNRPTSADLARQRTEAGALPYRPLITCVLQSDGAPPALLQRSLASLLGQSYERWELYVAARREGNRDAVMLEPRQAADPRVHLAPAPDASPRRTGQGDLTIFLDAGDVLAPDALFKVVQTRNAQPDADIIYFDEDHLARDGSTRSMPRFKPGWSPEMLLSVNYLSHAVFHRDLLDDECPLRELDARGQWDQALRASRRARRIHHIPSVLYHAGQARAPADVPDLTFIEAHCSRLGIRNATAAFVRPGIVRVTWATSDPKISVIVPTRNHSHLLRRCVASIARASNLSNVEILIVDTGSTETAAHDYYRGLSRHPRTRVIEYRGPFNFSAINNMAARRATGDLLLFLNNDTEALDPGWLEEMARWAERPEIGVVGAKLLYPNRTIQHAGLVLGMYGLVEHVYRYAEETRSDIFGSVDWYRNYLAVTGACMMIRREVFDEVGGFDEAYQVAMSDVEICLRIAAKGYRVLYTPFARLWHHEGATRGQYGPKRDTARACAHMAQIIQSGDPYFNPNLSCTSAIPSLPRRGEPSRLQLFDRLRRKACAPYKSPYHSPAMP